jgi:glycerol-3-phosphate acyltransferase PlsY
VTGIQVLGLVAAYLIGAIPFGLLAGLSKGVDVRTVGSGNIGATNVVRAVGLPMGVAVFALDVLKGLAGVVVCRTLGMEGWELGMAGLFAVLGHSFSPFLLFKGGKGGATSLGVIFAIYPFGGLMCLVTWLLLLKLTRYVSLASMIGVLVGPIVVYFMLPPHDIELTVMLSVIVLLIVGRHNENIERLFNGTESRIGSKRREETTDDE